MPADLVFHKGNALALDGSCENRGRLALDGLCLFDRALNLLKVVAVNLDDLKAERLKFFVERFNAADLLNGAVDLQTVLVY